ncbi:hypothetical protein LY76DRAFT_270438 [Colletotrichum caudatum]|nr:hypothetical protein LY76DRAFT_270438 [Colletotrichum caudatum]
MGRGRMVSHTAAHHDAKPQSSEPMKGWIPGVMTQLHPAEESCTSGNGVTDNQPTWGMAFGSIADNLSWRCPVSVANISKGTPCPASSIHVMRPSETRKTKCYSPRPAQVLESTAASMHTQPFGRQLDHAHFSASQGSVNGGHELCKSSAAEVGFIGTTMHILAYHNCFTTV